MAFEAGTVVTLLQKEDGWASARTQHPILRMADSLDLRMRRGEIRRLLGESGCGRNAASLSILHLAEPPMGPKTLAVLQSRP